MALSTTGVAFVLAVAAAVEMAALFYMASDPDLSWAEFRHSLFLAVHDPSGVVALVGTTAPMAVIVFSYFTRSGRAFKQRLRKTRSD